MNRNQKLKTQALPYQFIEPKTPEYRQVVITAISASDKETLSAIRDNPGKTIRLVHEWFFYALMASTWETNKAEADEVIIHTPKVRSQMIATLERLDWGQEERERKVLP